MFEKKSLRIGLLCMIALLSLLVGCGGKSAHGGRPKPEIDAKCIIVLVY